MPVEEFDPASAKNDQLVPWMLWTDGLFRDDIEEQVATQSTESGTTLKTNSGTGSYEADIRNGDI